MPHIHTSPNQHDHTVTAYIIRTDGSYPRVLLHRHKYLGKLLPPGGHIELDETPWAALLHEVREESGYDVSQLMVLQPQLRVRQEDVLGVTLHPQPILMNTHDITPDHYHSDTGYALLVREDPKYFLAAGESTDMRWLTVEDLMSLSGDEIWPNVRNTYLALVDRFMSEWEAVPASYFSAGK
ncbi:MAG: NUDIX domain-containing protein [Candidatus Saccharibacteria bacterium]|nr:NUDIX domain-containing protein [Candidatus Saccharibacteria bacterium]